MTSVSPNTHTILYACFMYAHIINIARPGTFDEEVNKMFKVNNLPPIKTPNNPPSQEILNVMAKQQDSNMEMAGSSKDNEKRTQEGKQEREKESEVFIIDEGEKTEPQKTKETNILKDTMMTQSIRKYPVQGEKVGLTIYTKQSVGWLEKGEFTRQELRKVWRTRNTNIHTQIRT